MWWSFNFYPAHSGGFFVKTNVQKEIGYYDTRYKCSADYDFFYKLIVTNKKKGMITKKNELISNFDTGGYSSKLSLFEHMIEETNIRINNKQNKVHDNKHNGQCNTTSHHRATRQRPRPRQ